MQDVLQVEVRPDGLRHVEGRPRIRWLASDVQEQRAQGIEHAGNGCDPPPRPPEVVGTGQPILVRAVGNSEVVGRRGDNRLHGARRQVGQDLDAVTEEEAVGGIAAAKQCVWGESGGHQRGF